MFGTVTRYDNQKGYEFIRKKRGIDFSTPHGV